METFVECPECGYRAKDVYKSIHALAWELIKQDGIGTMETFVECPECGYRAMETFVECPECGYRAMDVYKSIHALAWELIKQDGIRYADFFDVLKGMGATPWERRKIRELSNPNHWPFESVAWFVTKRGGKDAFTQQYIYIPPNAAPQELTPSHLTTTIFWLDEGSKLCIEGDARIVGCDFYGPVTLADARVREVRFHPGPPPGNPEILWVSQSEWDDWKAQI